MIWKCCAQPVDNGFFPVCISTSGKKTPGKKTLVPISDQYPHPIPSRSTFCSGFGVAALECHPLIDSSALAHPKLGSKLKAYPATHEVGWVFVERSWNMHMVLFLCTTKIKMQIQRELQLHQFFWHQEMARKNPNMTGWQWMLAACVLLKDVSSTCALLKKISLNSLLERR